MSPWCRQPWNCLSSQCCTGIPLSLTTEGPVHSSIRGGMRHQDSQYRKGTLNLELLGFSTMPANPPGLCLVLVVMVSPVETRKGKRKGVRKIGRNMELRNQFWGKWPPLFWCRDGEWPGRKRRRMRYRAWSGRVPICLGKQCNSQLDRLP